MASLGEILASIFGAANAGVEHRYAMATRGPDYLAKDEARNNAQLSQGLERGKLMQDAQLRQAITRAAAMAARQGPTSTITSDVGTSDQVSTAMSPLEVPADASDELAAAIGQENTRGEKERAALELQAAQIAAQLAISNRQYETPAERAQREAANQGLKNTGTARSAQIRGTSAVEATRLRGQGTTWQSSVDAEGDPVRVAVPKNATPGSTIGGPGTAMEQNRESMSTVAKSAAETLLHRLQDPEYLSVVGPAVGRLESWNAALLSGNPAFTGLKTEIKAISQVLTGIHNLRSAHAGQVLEDALSTTNSPDALSGAVRGALVVVDEFLRVKKERGAKGGLHTPGEAPAVPTAPGSGYTVVEVK